jgi:hypothetical protein
MIMKIGPTLNRPKRAAQREGDAGEDKAPHGEEDEAANAGQVTLGRVARQAEAAEGRRRHQEGRGDAGARVHQHHGAERGADQGDDHPVENRRRARARRFHQEVRTEQDDQRREADDQPEQGEAGQGAGGRLDVQQVRDGRIA